MLVWGLYWFVEGWAGEGVGLPGGGVSVCALALSLSLFVLFV